MKKSVKTVSSIFIIIFLSKLLGQLREIIFANFYGTGDSANAFLTASQIPLNFFDIILGMAIASAFIPVFNEYREKQGEKEANLFAGNFVGVVLSVSFIMIILGVVFSSGIVFLIVRGLNDSTAQLTSSLLKIMFPSLLFTAVAYSYAGILQSYGEFKIPAAMSVVSNAVTILYLLIFGDKFGVYGLSVSMLIGWVLQLLILVVPLKKRDYNFSLSFNFNDDGMKKVYKLAIPIFFSSWAQPLNVMVNTYIGSFLNSGQAISAISYANKLYLIVASVFAVSVTNMILPELSRLFVSDDKKQIAFISGNSVKGAILFLLPVTGMFLLFNKSIVEIIYQRGSFGTDSAILTSKALFWYSLGMTGYGIQEILNKSFYAMQKSKIPMKIAFVVIAINIFFSFTLSKVMGVGGLALSASIASTVGGIILLISMKRENSLFDLKDIAVSAVKGFISVAFAFLITYFTFDFTAVLGINLLAKLLVTGFNAVIFVVVYVIMLIIFRTKELNYLRRK